MSVNQVLAGLSMMPDDAFRASTYPLFEDGIVDWLEWTFDIGWSEPGIPDWLEQLLDFYGNERRLSGHGVQYSGLSAKWTAEHDIWLENLKIETARRKYEFVSEHFGYARAGDYTFSAPLPVPLCQSAVETGTENLDKIKQIVQCPVGLENLALAFGSKDVEAQGYFLDKLVAPLEGFIVLDLHNIYCQSINFGIPVLELIKSYPLERALEIHISGGSFSTSKHGYAKKPIRRDTHNGPVPDQLFKLLPEVLKLCPNVRVVILERLGNTFDDKKVHRQFADEFRKLKKVVDKYNKIRRTTSNTGLVNGRIRKSAENGLSTASAQELDGFQSTLYGLLEDDRNAEWIKTELSNNNDLQVFSNYFDSLEPRMLEVGQELIRKWGAKRR